MPSLPTPYIDPEIYVRVTSRSGPSYLHLKKLRRDWIPSPSKRENVESWFEFGR
jgi:hypothetical protein